jgi:FixJ family two-component response regulator
MPSRKRYPGGPGPLGTAADVANDAAFADDLIPPPKLANADFFGPEQVLIRSLGYSATAFASAEDYLQSDSARASSCLITDIQMPGMSGAELQDYLIADGNPTPIIFMTAFFDEKIRTRVLKAGGHGFLKKPLDENELVQCLEKALKSAA